MTDSGKLGRRRISRRAILAAAGVVVVSPFAAAAWGYDPDWLVMRRYAVSVPRLDRVTRVVQVSDLHADQDGSCSLRLRERVAEAVRRASPDWVFATGDYITRPGDSIEEAASWVAGLDAHEGVFAVMGNHDSPPVKAALVGKGVTVLGNAWTRVSGIAVAGVGDLSRWPHKPQKVLRTVPPGVGIVLLAHQPDSFWSYDIPVTLQLSGHTHGGQATLLGTVPATKIIPSLKPLLMKVPALACGRRVLPGNPPGGLGGFLRPPRRVAALREPGARAVQTSFVLLPARADCLGAQSGLTRPAPTADHLHPEQLADP